MSPRPPVRIRRRVRELKAYVPGEQPAGDAVKLNTNENPFPPSPRVAEALRAFAADRLRLYPDPLCAALREQIARLHGCAPAQVLVGNGSDEILALCVRALVESDGEVGYFNPSYSLYPVLAAIEGLGTRPVDLGPAFDWRMPEDYDADLFFLTNPNAPTGMLHPRAEIEAYCRRTQGVVVLDEAYVDFAREHLMDLALHLPNVVVARSLSKSHSLAGLRVGYAVGPEPLIDALYKVKDSYNVSQLAQALAAAALADAAHMRAGVDKVRATRARATEELRRRGYEVFPSETNFLWIKPPRQAARDVFDHLRVRRVYVRYFAGLRTGDYLRVTVGTDADMDVFLATLPP